MKTEFAYMKKYKTKTYCIVYQWNKYYVTELLKNENGGVFIVNAAGRMYKTLSGAERYLLSLSNVCDSATKPEILYGTEQFIREGSYWK